MSNKIIETQVAVIGGGITGTAVARELTKYWIDVSLIDKEPAFGFGITKGCQGMLHGGMLYLASRAVKFHGGMDFGDYLRLPLTLKDKLGNAGRDEMFYMAHLLDLDIYHPGSMLIAENKEDIELISLIKDVAEEQGVKNLKLLDEKGLREKEPHINERYIGALWDPNEATVLPTEWAIAFGEHAEINGAHIYKATEVQDIEEKKGYYLIKTNNGTLKAEYIVNAAGFYSDKIASMVDAADFEMTGWKTQIMVMENNNYLKHVMLTAPRPQKVRCIIPTAHNSILFSHTFHPFTDKEDRDTTKEALYDLKNWPSETFKELPVKNVVSSFSNFLCYNTKNPDDHLLESPKRGFINAVVGAPGLGPAPAIARIIARMLADQGLELTAKSDFNPYRNREPRFIDLDNKKKNELIREEPAYGHMVCRCMHVSEQEIKGAVRSGGKTLDEMKFKTLAGMGRCQGGFCTSRVLKIISEESGISPLEVTKKGEGSYILDSMTK